MAYLNASCKTERLNIDLILRFLVLTIVTPGTWLLLGFLRLQHWQPWHLTGINKRWQAAAGWVYFWQQHASGACVSNTQVGTALDGNARWIDHQKLADGTGDHEAAFHIQHFIYLRQVH